MYFSARSQNRKNIIGGHCLGCVMVAMVMLEFALPRNSVASPTFPTWKVQTSKQAEILITDKVVHSNDPKLMFGFNINYSQFQQQLWDQNQKPKDGIIEALRPFQGAIYRYPGGLVANTFHWKEAIGPVGSRQLQKSFFKKEMEKVQFGIDEYFDFISELSGMPWYVLNVVGVDLESPFSVAKKELVAQSNIELAKYISARIGDGGQPLYLELGNELDRSRYEWTADQYADRVSAVVNLFEAKSNLENIRFVSALRDFKWRYKRKESLPDSRPEDYMRAVLAKVGSAANNYSLHHYYDGNRLEGKSRSIPFWLKFLARSIDDYRELKNKPANIWITEHGRQPMSRQPGKDRSKQSTSNMAAAISTADYLIAVSQFPEVKGAVWHGLNAGPWQLFDYSVKHNDLRPRPIYWGLRVLRTMQLENSLETFTSSPNISNYAGGYDIRAVAFRDQSKKKLGIRIVNRAPKLQKVKLNYNQFSGQDVNYKLYSVSLPENMDVELEDDRIRVNLDPVRVAEKFSDDGILTVEIPASSVSVLSIRMIK